MKGMYKLIDSKGRVYLPRELRDALESKLCIQKVHLIEIGDQSPEAVETYVHAAAAAMPREKQVELAAMLLEKNRKVE